MKAKEAKLILMTVLLMTASCSTPLSKLKQKIARTSGSHRDPAKSHVEITNDYSDLNEESLQEWRDFSTVPHSCIEAQSAKKSAVDLGYYADDFISYVNRDKSFFRFTAIDHRSYWMRAFTMRSIQKDFLTPVGDSSDSIERQIINIGCGLDTAAFNLVKDKSKYVNFTYYEFDLQEIAEEKATLIRETPEILRLFPKAKFAASSGPLVDASIYKLDSCNLYDLASMDKKFKTLKLDFSKPTLVLTEVVLQYVESQQISKVLKFFADRFERLVMADMTLTNLDGKYGEDMLKYYQDWEIPILGKDFYYSPQTIREEIQKAGLKPEVKLDSEVYSKCIDPLEIKRIEAIEAVDHKEYKLHMEEMKHYCMSLAKKCSDSLSDGASSVECRIINRLSLDHFHN